METTSKIMQFDLYTTDEIAEEFGKRIRANRLMQNLQQSELAARAGVSERSLSNFERTGRGTFDVFLRLIWALGLAGAMSDLFVAQAPLSIKAMEAAEIKRQRATRTRRKNP